MGCSGSNLDPDQLQACSCSVQRPLLRRLSRRQLRSRLAELGAAKTEAEGLFHGELVDVVLLWNALWKLHLNEREEQEEAIRALKKSGLPAHLLRRALLVVGVSWQECCNLNGKEAEALLNQRLVQLLMRKVAANFISGTTFSLLVACFQGWKLLKGSCHLPDVAGAAQGAVDCDTVFEGLREESRRRDEVIGLMEQGRREEAARLVVERDELPQVIEDEEDPAYWQNGVDDDLAPENGDAKADGAVVPKKQKKQTKNDGEAKEAKNDGDAKEEIPSGAPKEQSSPTSGDKISADTRQPVTPEKPMPAQEGCPRASDSGARDRKFDALDSELAQCLDDVEETSPLAPRV